MTPSIQHTQRLLAQRQSLGGVVVLVMIALALSAGPAARTERLASLSTIFDAETRVVLPEQRQQHRSQRQHQREEPGADALSTNLAAISRRPTPRIDAVGLALPGFRLVAAVTAGLLDLPPPATA